MKKLFLFILLTATFFSGCKQNSTAKKENKPDKASIKAEINNLEKELFSNKSNTIDFAKAEKLTDAYIRYADRYPEDSMAPEYLFKASDITMNMNRPAKTINLYDRLINKYPGYKNIPTCYFLKAFVYDDQLKNYDEAGKFYRLYLKKYPEGEFADDATMALKYLGKSPEELIKTFESKNKQEK